MFLRYNRCIGKMACGPRCKERGAKSPWETATEGTKGTPLRAPRLGRRQPPSPRTVPPPPHT